MNFYKWMDHGWHCSINCYTKREKKIGLVLYKEVIHVPISFRTSQRQQDKTTLIKKIVIIRKLFKSSIGTITHKFTLGLCCDHRFKFYNTTQALKQTLFNDPNFTSIYSLWEPEHTTPSDFNQYHLYLMKLQYFSPISSCPTKLRKPEIFTL